MDDRDFPPDFFYRAVETVGVGVAAYDQSGRYRYVNQRYADLFDADPAELVGEALWDVVSALDADRFDDYWDSFDPYETRVDETAHEYNGQRVAVEAVTTAQPFDDGHVHFGTVRDITERRQRERTLQRQNERLDSFAGVVSHDLRNPLNVAQAYVGLLGEDIDRDEIELAEGALERMETLIDDLLSLARGGDVVDDPEPTDLGRTARNAWQMVETGDATVEIADRTREIPADPSRLQQLFENLFRNAVEHGAPASGESSADTGTIVRVGVTDGGFYVADDGPGVDGSVERLGDLVNRGESTSLGLQIVQQVVDAHGWTVHLNESDAGGLRVDVTGA